VNYSLKSEHLDGYLNEYINLSIDNLKRKKEKKRRKKKKKKEKN
jgi:hypothetical protein